LLTSNDVHMHMHMSVWCWYISCKFHICWPLNPESGSTGVSGFRSFPYRQLHGPGNQNSNQRLVLAYLAQRASNCLANWCTWKCQQHPTKMLWVCVQKFGPLCNHVITAQQCWCWLVLKQCWCWLVLTHSTASITSAQISNAGACCCWQCKNGLADIHSHVHHAPCTAQGLVASNPVKPVQL